MKKNKKLIMFLIVKLKQLGKMLLSFLAIADSLLKKVIRKNPQN
jgi:hypothetical protein